MLERTLYQPLVAGGLDHGWALYRIEDGGYGRKPCDIGGWSASGRGVCLEVKVVTEHRPDAALPWRQFELHQVGWLQKARHLRALPLVALFDEREGRMIVYRVGAERAARRNLTQVELVKARTGIERYHGPWSELEI